MEFMIQSYGVGLVAAAFAVLALAGFVKGAVGFALPMIAISGVGSFMSAEAALAALLLPGLITNILQAFRNGAASAWGTLRDHWRLNLVLFVLIGLVAQVVVKMSDALFFTLLGAGLGAVGVLQLLGWRPRIRPRHYARAEWITGTLAGIFGGLAGVWGPPILFYLLARDTPRVEMVRAQGISFLIGSVILVAGHVVSGVLNAQTWSFSALLVIPAMLGMLAGRVVQDRLDQALFRKLTLAVLVLAALNLLRRGLTG